MDQFSGSSNWSMIPNIQAQGNFGTPSNQDHLFLQQQQFHQQQQQTQQQQQQFQPQQQEMQFQQFQQQQQFIQQQKFHQQRLLHSPPSQQPSLQSPPPPQTVVHTPQSMMHTPQQQQIVHTPQQSVQTPQQHQSLASHFHLYPLVEKLNDAIETGARDQNSDALVTELNSHFEKCQQLLNSISGSLGSKTMTVDGQKRNLEESEQLLQQRRELIVEYRRSIEELVKIEP
ncbi:unnamed protein product [Microthlaspi erraticum]|uniref:Mediator of RNA polymerase II transcription subunit 9 n=1 Tax=Microthlaspi erraticum TaxID=1685480 RepID=A0A6D2HZ31_9BRAS|nr:unnamed protein product [Microthlaspi erraticum]